MKIIPWAWDFGFEKDSKKGRWYLKIHNKKIKIENIYSCQTPEAFMTKLGFVSINRHKGGTSVFSEAYPMYSTTFNASDVTKMKLVQILVDQRIKAVMDNTARQARN